MLIFGVLLVGIAKAQDPDCLRDKKLVQYVNMRHGPALSDEILQLTQDLGSRVIDARRLPNDAVESSIVLEEEYRQLLRFWPKRHGFVDLQDTTKTVVFLGLHRFTANTEMRFFQFWSDGASFILSYVTCSGNLRSVAELASFASFVSQSYMHSVIAGDTIATYAPGPSDVSVRPEAMSEFKPRERKALAHGSCYTLRVRNSGTLSPR